MLITHVLENNTDNINLTNTDNINLTNTDNINLTNTIYKKTSFTLLSWVVNIVLLVYYRLTEWVFHRRTRASSPVRFLHVLLISMYLFLLHLMVTLKTNFKKTI